jgi:hypothetical protein
METMSDDRPEPPRSWQRWLVTVLLVVAIVHSAVLALWLAPSSPLRNAVGSSSLSTYVDPYFQQSRDVVGPGAQFVDESFQLRATVRPKSGAKPELTDWIDVTEDEIHRSLHDIAPARVHVIARRLATNLNLAMFNLDPAQRKYVRSVRAKDLPSKVRAKLERLGSNPVSVRTYLAYDTMAAQFASLYAQAAFGDDVVEIQYRVGRRTVPSRAGRDTLGDVEFLHFDFGWRRFYRGPLEARTAFDSYVGD